MMPAGPPIAPPSSACTCKVTHAPDGSGSRLFPDPKCVVHHGSLVVDLARVPVHGLQAAIASPPVERGQGYGQKLQAPQVRTQLGIPHCPKCDRALGDLPGDIGTARAMGVELRCDGCGWQGKDWVGKPA